MDIARIFSMVSKGLGVVTMLAQQGKDISQAVTAMKNVVSKRPQDVTDEELDEAERILDEKLDEFEKPLKRTE
jgi:hypothetical protein